MNSSDQVFNKAVDVVRRLHEQAHEAYFAGGCVRDKLLGLVPKDYDIATSALPEQVVKIFPKTVQVGKAFGVVIVIMGDPPLANQFEVATFRTEGKYLDGRHPQWVKFADYKEDVLRRDFTINGMLYDPLTDQVIDIVGGQEDLKKKTIRTIGDPYQRFDEDKLRMIRAIRFACQLDFEVDQSCLRTIEELSAKILEVSFERIRDELKAILISSNRSRGIKMLIHSGILKCIIPEVCALEKIDQPKEFHPEGDVLTHTLLGLDYLLNPTLEIALGLLLHDIGKPVTYEVKDGRIRFNAHDTVGEKMALEICKRLKLSREETEKICYLVRNHLKFKDVQKMRQSTLRKFMSELYFEDLVIMCKADIMAASKDLGAIDFVEAMKKVFEKETLKPPPLLRGSDLIGLGLKPGPLFSQILKKIEEKQLDGELKNQDQAIDFVKETWKEFFKR